MVAALVLMMAPERAVTVVSSAGGGKRCFPASARTPCLTAEAEIYNFIPLRFYWLLRIRRGRTGEVFHQWGTGAPIYDNQNIISILSSPAENVTFKAPTAEHKLIFRQYFHNVAHEE